MLCHMCFFVVLSFFSCEIRLEKRLTLCKHYEQHYEQVDRVRKQLERIDNDFQCKRQWKLIDLQSIRQECERNRADLRTIDIDSVRIDRLADESQTTMIDSIAQRSIVFVDEIRLLYNLLDQIEHQVNAFRCRCSLSYY
jgi:hypothetical protein